MTMAEIIDLLRKEWEEEKDCAIEVLEQMGYAPEDLKVIYLNLEGYPDLDDNAGFNFTYGYMMALDWIHQRITGISLPTVTHAK